ncbi:MAG: RNA methyltransferase [Kiritimatiellae bacterium]|nr:RNA methyltransferase [Kiritimatiellia bacterium]
MNTRLPPVIQSTDNPAFKKLMALQTTHGIRKHGEFLVAGPKIIAEALRQKPKAVTAWIATPDMPLPHAELSQGSLVLLSKGLFREVNLFGAPGPLLAMQIPDLPAFQPEAPWPEGCTLFIPFGDPENVGGAIRAAAGLDAARIVLLREAACPFLPKAVRASAGATWKIRLESGPSLAELPAIKSAPLFALDMEGTPLENVKHPVRYGLVAGMEGQGLTEALRRHCRQVSIPMANRIESLNAASAIAIALWAWR